MVWLLYLFHNSLVKVAASGLPRFIGLAIVIAAILVVIGMLYIVHRASRARRKINFEVNIQNNALLLTYISKLFRKFSWFTFPSFAR